jgi:aerobic-type carbon monoxide dehydrogenase small subunit (CoxS/CutS family)
MATICFTWADDDDRLWALHGSQVVRRITRERMSGNLCRCGAYNGLVAAIEEALVEAAR